MDTFSDKGKLSKAFADKHTCLKDIWEVIRGLGNSERKNIQVGKNIISNCLSF